MDFQKALEPKTLDTVSFKSNSSLYYTSQKQKYADKKNRIRSSNPNSQENVENYFKHNKSQKFDTEIYKVNRSLFKKDMLCKRDKTYILEFKPFPKEKRDVESLNGEDIK